MAYHKNKYSESKNIYQRVTDYVIKELEKGTVPWQKGWNCYGLPRNTSSGYVYHGWNTFLLNYITASEQYRSPFFLTYNQARSMGGYIREGSEGYQVIYWKRVDTNYKALKGGVNETEENEYPKSRLVLRVYIVFNIDQTEGIEFTLPATKAKTEQEKLENCDRVIIEMPGCPPIRHGGDSACYYPGTDFIQMPHFQQFHEPELYYKTLFHELTHSTGHPRRLNRKELEFFQKGDERYSREELTAELGAAYLCAYTGIDQKTIDNSASYINYWLQKLQNDKTLLIKASSQAQAATDYILNLKKDDEVQTNGTKNIAV